MLREECGTAKDEVHAAELARLSAEQGISAGQDQYERVHHESLGAAKDEVQAAKYYKLSADQGYS